MSISNPRCFCDCNYLCGCNYHPTLTSCCCCWKTCKSHHQQCYRHPLLGNIVITVKTRRWMSPHHPEIHMWKMSVDWNLSSEWGHTGHTVCKWTRILMHLCSLTGSTQSICGACNAFRGSSHQLGTPPSSLHQWETPPFSSHHSQLKAPTLMVPPRSYSEDLQFQNFSLAVDDKM